MSRKNILGNGLGKDITNVTVLMVVRNEERYVGASIGSILEQTYKNFYFLIIDDGSTDGTWDIINSFKDKRIQAIRFKDWQGLTKRLNWGLKKIKTEFVARMDSHNIADSRRLELQRNFMIKNKDVVLVGGGKELGPEDVREIIFRKNIFRHSSWFFRYEEIKNVGFYNEKYRFAQDYDLLLRLTAKYKVVSLAENLVTSVADGVSKQYRFFQAGYAFRAKLEALARGDYWNRLSDLFYTQGYFLKSLWSQKL